MVASALNRQFGDSSTMAVKAPVLAVALTNLPLAGLVQVGAYLPNEGDRILVAGQTDPTQNGIYYASVSGWQRSGDFDGSFEFTQGTLIAVASATGQGPFYQLVTPSPVIGQPLTFLPAAVPAPFPATPREAAVPIVGLYQEGDVRRYGVAGDGITDDTVAINNALLVGKQGVVIYFQPWHKCITQPLTISQANANVPPIVRGNGATLKAKAGSVGALVTIENPHGVWWDFQFGGFVVDANHLCSISVKVHGSQAAEYSSLDCINSTGPGFQSLGEAGFGIYNNTFRRIRGGLNGSPNVTYGIQEISNGAAYFNNANKYDTCIAQYNLSDGFNIDFAQNDHINCDAEQNAGYGANINHTQGMKWLGGYLENNNGAGAGYAVHITGGTGGLIWLPSRINGGANPADNANWAVAGNYFGPGQTGTNPVADALGNFIVESLKCRTSGVSMNGANVISNTLNFSAALAAALAMAGTTLINFPSSATAQAQFFGPITPASSSGNSGTSSLWGGAGAPAAGVGTNGDYYLRSDTPGTANQRLYVKSAGAWSGIV